jgi:thiol-disulfide isomerase/thioredoxin
MMFVSLGIGGVLAVALIVVMSVLTGGTVSTTSATPPPALVGKSVPVQTIRSLTGGTTTTPWKFGHPTALIFFASWCEPCKTELPHLATYLAHHSTHGVQVVAVDSEVGQSDSPSNALAMLRRYHFNVATMADTQGKMVNEFGLVALPDSAFVNAKGVVTWLNIGPITATAFAQRLAQAAA